MQQVYKQMNWSLLRQAFLKLQVATKIWLAKLFWVGHKTMIQMMILCVYFYFIKSLKCHIRYNDSCIFILHPPSFLSPAVWRQSYWLHLGPGFKMLRKTDFDPWYRNIQRANDTYLVNQINHPLAHIIIINLFLLVHNNTVLPSTSTSSSKSFSSTFTNQNDIKIPSSPIHATCPVHFIFLHFST